MILSRQNLKGGRKVAGFPLREEEGRLGYFLGYCEGCNQSMLLCMQDRDLLVATFHYEDKTLQQVRKLLKPKISLLDNLLKWLVNWLRKYMDTPTQLIDNI